MCWAPPGCTGTTPLCRFWPRARPGPVGCGPTSAMIGRLPDRRPPPRCFSIPATATASIRGGIWLPMPASFRPTLMAGSIAFTIRSEVQPQSPRRPAGAMDGGSSLSWPISPSLLRAGNSRHHLPSRQCAGSTRSSQSRVRSTDCRQSGSLAVRATRIAPLVAELESWMRRERARLSRHADVAKAMDYMLKRWAAFTRFLSDGRICLTNNAAERALRGIAIGRKNWLFAGSDRGGERAASMYTLIATAKLNNVDPQAWLADVLRRIADHPARRLHELLPWNWHAPAIGHTLAA